MPIAASCERAAAIAGRPYGGNLTVPIFFISGCVWYSAGGSFYFINPREGTDPNYFITGGGNVTRYASQQLVCWGAPAPPSSNTYKSSPLVLYSSNINRGQTSVCVCVCECVCVCVCACACLCVCVGVRARADADPRRRYCPFALARANACARADAGGRRTPWRSPLGWAVRALRYCHRRPRSGDAPARARALDGVSMAASTRVRHARIVRRFAAGGRPNCARRCAQGSWTARSTPTSARQATRRSSRRRGAPVRPPPSAGRTMAF
jgi:hypothetical protein